MDYVPSIDLFILIHTFPNYDKMIVGRLRNYIEKNLTLTASDVTLTRRKSLE